MITVHGSPLSPYVRKVLILLEEKGIEFESIDVNPFPPTAEYLKISPLGLIPALTDGDLAIPDSSAICAYLEKRFPTTALYPDGADQFGRALWYETYADDNLVEGTGRLFFLNRVSRLLGDKVDDAAITKIQKETQPPLFDYLESEIANKNYLCGEQFSIADISITTQFIQLKLAGFVLDPNKYPKITRYVEFHSQRPSFAKWISTAEETVNAILAALEAQD